jgi:hypothetical protein
MISDEVGQKLHDRATRGETLATEEQAQLEQWYAQHDREELERLSADPVPSELTDLQSRVRQASAQVVVQAQRIESLTAENAQLRQEIAALQRLLSAKLMEQPV